MTSGPSVADRLAAALGTVLGTGAPPWRLRAWDGSETGPPDAPVVAVRSPSAVRRLVWAPGELGLARAYVAGEIDIDGDIFDTLDALSPVTRSASTDAFPRPCSARSAGRRRRHRRSSARPAGAGCTASAGTPRRSPTTTT